MHFLRRMASLTFFPLPSLSNTLRICFFHCHVDLCTTGGGVGGFFSSSEDEDDDDEDDDDDDEDDDEDDEDDDDDDESESNFFFCLSDMVEVCPMTLSFWTLVPSATKLTKEKLPCPMTRCISFCFSLEILLFRRKTSFLEPSSLVLKLYALASLPMPSPPPLPRLAFLASSVLTSFSSFSSSMVVGTLCQAQNFSMVFREKRLLFVWKRFSGR